MEGRTAKTPHEAGLGSSERVSIPRASNQITYGRAHRVSGCSRKSPQETRFGPDRFADRLEILGVAVGCFRRSRGRARELLAGCENRLGRTTPSTACTFQEEEKVALASQSDPHDYLDDKALRSTPRSMNLQTRSKKLWKIRPGECRSSDFRNQKPGVSFRTW